MEKAQILEQIEKSVGSCRKCRLYEKAKNAVPGEGNINAELIFVGEAPGETEDLTGRPFVGRAGKLLESLLSDISMTRKDVWIGNIIKHRPPNNREPMEDEIEACVPYLALQLKVLNPVLIVTLGRFAMNFFYKEGKITRDHGQLIRQEHFSVFPVYHPAAALRNPEFAKVLRDDFLKIPVVMKSLKEHTIDGYDNGGIKSEGEGQLGLGL
ncbi:MAG: uracil-DNA glycosylase [Patescibacteria group bacterium]|jgi:DNA polymerase